jgi:hypothetical protein
MIGVDVIAAAGVYALQPDAGMLVRPDAIVAIFGAFLNTSQSDGGFSFWYRRGCWGSVVHLCRQCLLHSLLLALFDVQEFIRYHLTIVFLICSLS